MVYIQGRLPEQGNPSGALELVRNAWQLNELELGYSEFISSFTPILEDAGELEAVDAFYVRTFLIHEYRRILLRDPGLPEPLLPEDWHGHAARALAGDLYRRVCRGSERYVDASFANRNGTLPHPDASFEHRFQD